MERFYKILPSFSFNDDQFQFISLRDIDKMQIMKWRNDQIYHLRQKEKLTIQSQKKYFKEVIDTLFENELPSQLLFSILKEGKLVAYGGLVHIDWDSKLSELSLIIDTNLEKLYFKEIWMKFLKFSKYLAFSKLYFEKIFTYAFDVRPDLYSILEQSGFILEAKLRNHVRIEKKQYDVIIHSFCNPHSGFYLEEAQYSDKIQLLDWANEFNVRKNSLNSNIITQEDHDEWFESKIKNPNCKIYIAKNIISNNLGQIRLDLKNNIWYIDYSVDYSIRGLGLGRLLVQKVIELNPNSSFAAIVKLENLASIKIFESLGFNKTKIDNQIKFILHVEK